MTRPNLLILIFALMTFLPSVAAAEPLHDTTAAGDIAEVKRLLAAGANANTQNEVWDNAPGFG